uniref:Proliferating cell nuclear antigen n=1 Tax=Lingulaulax polyedra TaxID=160621 RepID=A0A516AG23_LINPO|nr:proliferating cell nuclear antigen [Lingulodinium polyedra]
MPHLPHSTVHPGKTRPSHSPPGRGPASLVDLRSQVELHVAVVVPLEVVLHQQRRVGPQAELHGPGERGGLGKVDEVAQREGRGHGLVHREAHPLLRLLRLPGLQHDVARAHVALHAEGDALLAGTHLCIPAELLKAPADPQELRRGQLRRDLVVLLRDLHVLALDLHELQLEVGDAVLLAALALEAHSVCVAAPPELQRVAGAAHLQDLR